MMDYKFNKIDHKSIYTQDEIKEMLKKSMLLQEEYRKEIEEEEIKFIEYYNQVNSEVKSEIV